MKKPLIKYSQKKVLVIDDFAEFARSLRGMLQGLGCKNIDLVYNGEDAIQSCKEKQYDIILSDYNLGDSKDGQQVLEELMTFNLLKTNTVFLMITAENTTAMVMGALEFQPDNYLTKPFNRNILNARLDKAIFKKDLLAPIIQNIRQNNFSNAVKMCDETINQHPKFRMACLKHKFNCLRGLKQYDEALELATLIINERPISWAMLGVGKIFYAQKELQRAVDLFNDMLNEFPMALEAYDWLAKIQYQLGQPIEAQKTLAKAIERSPKALHRQKKLGQIAEENNDIKAMTNAFRQAVKLGKSSAFSSPNEFIKLTKSIGLQLEDNTGSERKKLIKESESVFGKLDKRFSTNPTVQFRSAVAHANFGAITNDDSKVKKYLNTANKLYERIEEHIGSEESIEISESLKNLGQTELAESILEEAVEQYFDDPDFIKKAAKLTNNKNLIANSKKANQLNNKAITNFKVNDFDIAIEYFNKALKIAANNINIKLNYVQSLLKRSQTKQAHNDDLKTAEELLSGITRLSPEDTRFARYSELSRLTQLMIQKL